MPKIDRTAIPTIDRWLTEQRGTTTGEEAQLLAVRSARAALATFANATPRDRRLPPEILTAYEALSALEVAMIDGFRETNEEVS